MSRSTTSSMRHRSRLFSLGTLSTLCITLSTLYIYADRFIAFVVMYSGCCVRPVFLTLLCHSAYNFCHLADCLSRLSVDVVLVSLSSAPMPIVYLGVLYLRLRCVYRLIRGTAVMTASTRGRRVYHPTDCASNGRAIRRWLLTLVVHRYRL